MDFQIKNQQIKDKDICENSELTAELNFPKEAESGKEGWA